MRIPRMTPLFLATILFLAAVACGGVEAEVIEGLLQNVDSASGQITIVTKDGKTVTLTIDTEAPVESEGTSSTLESLEIGASLEAEVDENNQVLGNIKARQAKIEGTIKEITGDELTVETLSGLTRTVRVTDSTRIELDEDFPGILADLEVGQQVEVKFDPESQVAFKIDTEEEEAEIEGTIAEIDSDTIAVETERGRRLTLSIGDRTRIELEDDLPGTFADLQIGARVEAKFDPYTRTAFKIEVGEG